MKKTVTQKIGYAMLKMLAHKEINQILAVVITYKLTDFIKVIPTTSYDIRLEIFTS